MADHLESRIRDLAHQKWIDDGKPEGRHLEHWLAAEGELAGHSGGQAKNEGEGNVTAALEYNAETKAFVKSGRVAAKAQEAKNALNGPEAPELKRAEQAGRRRSRGEDSGGVGV